VNFGQRPWWYGGHFCQKAGKTRGWVKNTIADKQKEKVLDTYKNRLYKTHINLNKSLKSIEIVVSSK
jgi:hypothetical protein